ncbi:hypothetical protein H4S06_005499, partial [Coemansia sp. BCRC 34490]
IHFFDDIGYRHENFARCPETKALPLSSPSSPAALLGMDLKCTCPTGLDNFDTSRGSCLRKWKSYLPSVWTIKDTDEAIQMVRNARFLTSGREPKMINERRRWYDFFGRF